MTIGTGIEDRIPQRGRNRSPIFRGVRGRGISDVARQRVGVEHGAAPAAQVDRAAPLLLAQHAVHGGP